MVVLAVVVGAGGKNWGQQCGNNNTSATVTTPTRPPQGARDYYYLLTDDDTSGGDLESLSEDIVVQQITHANPLGFWGLAHMAPLRAAKGPASPSQPKSYQGWQTPSVAWSVDCESVQNR